MDSAVGDRGTTPFDLKEGVSLRRYRRPLACPSTSKWPCLTKEESRYCKVRRAGGGSMPIRISSREAPSGNRDTRFKISSWSLLGILAMHSPLVRWIILRDSNIAQYNLARFWAILR